MDAGKKFLPLLKTFPFPEYEVFSPAVFLHRTNPKMISESINQT